MTEEKRQIKTLGIRDLLPGLWKTARRLPSIAASGLSTFTLFDDLPLSVGAILERNARKYKNNTALLFEDRSWTYGVLNDITNRFAHYFQSAGVKRGDAVIVLLDNRPETIMITAALAKIGAAASLINPHQRGPVLAHSINLKPGALYCIGVELVEAFEAIRGELSIPPGRLVGVRDLLAVNFPSDYADLYHEAADLPSHAPEVTRDIRTKEHLAYIFTSGTTGLPKASIQTHKQWLRSMHWFGNINLHMNSDDVVYVSIPFYHANALMISWPSTFGAGAALAMRRKFSVSEFWNDVRKFKATTFVYIGEVCRYLMNRPEAEEDRQHSIKKVVGNGLRPDIWKSFKERFGVEEIYEFYGASDSNIIFTNTFNLDSTVGWSPASFAIVEYDTENDEPVRDKKGFMKRVKTGETGLMISEITRMFPFAGYVNNQKNADKVFTDVFKKGDQWFNTGDLMRDIGYKHTQFVDRVGDTFRWKGENVATAEVEQTLHELDWVSSASVYGVQLPGCDGRAGMAAVIPCCAPDEIDFGQTLAQLKKALPGYAIPYFIRLTDSFELTDTQKVKKGKLKEEAYQRKIIADPIYFLPPGAPCYVPFDESLEKAIEAQDLSL